MNDRGFALGIPSFKLTRRDFVKPTQFVRAARPVGGMVQKEVSVAGALASMSAGPIVFRGAKVDYGVLLAKRVI